MSIHIPKNRLQAIRSAAIDGTMCDSQTERDMYNAFLRMGVDFEFQKEIILAGPTIPKVASKKEILLQPLFADRCAESVTMTVDFVLKRTNPKVRGLVYNGEMTYYCDAKGSKEHSKTVSRLKYDLLKHKLYREGLSHCSRVIFVEAAEVKRLLNYAAYDPKGFWEIFDQIKER